MAKEIARMKTRVAAGGPAWQVTRYHPDRRWAPTPMDLDPKFYIAISAYHHLVDGIGGLRLSLSLLVPDYPLLSGPGLALRMEDVIDISPSLPHLLQEGYHELIAPSLPSFFRRTPCWPGEKVRGNPIDFPEAQSAVHLPASWILALKQVGQAQGVSTLHPIIEVALILALHETLGSPEGTYKVGTPVNERNASDARYPHIGSNFFSRMLKQYSHLDLPNKAPRVEDANIFWTLVRSTASHHSSSRARQSARFEQGMLAYVPNPSPFSSPYSEDIRRRTKTGWEDFFWGASERLAPFRTSMGISNLGRVTLPPGCSGTRWSQSAFPFDMPLLVSVVGHGMGLEVSVAFRDGCAVTDGEVETMVGRFMAILGGLI